MTTKQKDVLLAHDYDGIQELDNDLPPWWLYLFYLTIAFSVIYMVYYHVTGAGDLMMEEYQKELNPQAVSGFDISYHSPYYKREGAVPVTAQPGAETSAEPEMEAPVMVLTPLTDEESLAKGKSIYATNCAVCHGPNGEGGIGPNMTDDYYIHGGSITDLAKIINSGVPAKGMIPWDKTLTPEQIHQVASYLVTLRGTNVPNGKAPQGDLYSGE